MSGLKRRITASVRCLRSKVSAISLYSTKRKPLIVLIGYPNLDAGASGVSSTVMISTFSPAFAMYLSISLNRLAYPETCVNGVGSTSKPIRLGALVFCDCMTMAVLVGERGTESAVSVARMNASDSDGSSHAYSHTLATVMAALSSSQPPTFPSRCAVLVDKQAASRSRRVGRVGARCTCLRLPPRRQDRERTIVDRAVY
mmetsp:Transcript_89905/g.257085  ORF Transcript_89905/g.257085 Transcript_89905/m.257085 type:complete len:200 (+) Transcript_89905:452-1051(+)